MKHVVRGSDGTELAYRVVGKGPKDVLLVHGWMVSGAVHDDLLREVGDAGLRFVVPDLRGAGASGKPGDGYTLAQYARDLVAVVDHAGLGRFAVVGHSMGGQLGLLLAATQVERVTGAALLCPVPPRGAPLPKEVADLFRTSGEDRGKQGAILDNVCRALPAAAKERLLDDAGAIPARCIEQAFDAWSGGFDDGRHDAALQAVRAPVLVVATDDPALPRSLLETEVVARVPGAALAYLPDAGHYPLVERPRETAAVVRAFLTALA